MNKKLYLPIDLNIEITDHCNLRCPMCFHSNLPWVHGERYPKKFMEIETVEKILKQLSDDNLKIKCLSPFWSGESLMHPRFREIANLIFNANNEKDLFDDFVINTNAVFLTHEISDVFIDYAMYIDKYAVWKKIFILLSLDFVTPSVFKKVKGGKKELAKNILSNIEYLLQKRAHLNLKYPRIVFQFVIQESNKSEVREFLKYWSSKLDAYDEKYKVSDNPGFDEKNDTLCITKLLGEKLMNADKEFELHRKALSDIGFYSSDYSGQMSMDQVYSPAFRRPCYQLWHVLMLTSRGIVTPCCRDRMLELALGNINEDTLLEIWNGNKLKEIRMMHIKAQFDKLPLCASCARCFFSPGGSVNDREVIKYLESLGREEEIRWYSGKVSEERLTGTAVQNVNKKVFSDSASHAYQLRLYDFYIHKDNPDSFILTKKVGGLEFEQCASLKVTYRFCKGAKWILLDYLTKNNNWEGFNFINILIKGDGRSGELKFVIVEDNGGIWRYAIKDAFQDAEWKLFTLPLDEFIKHESKGKESLKNRLGRIKGYRLLFEYDESAVKEEKTVFIGNIYLSCSRSQALNICLISREYPVETGWGGIGTYTHHLAHALAERGHKVHVISQGLEKEQDYRDGDVHVHRILHENYFYNKTILEEFALRLEYSKAVYRKLVSLINDYNIDIVEGPNLSAETFFYSFNKKIPVVTRLHTNFSGVLDFAGHRRTLDSKLSCWLEDSSILRSDLIICSTKAHAERIDRETGITTKRIRIIPLGIPLPKNNELVYKDIRPYKVLFVGRLEERKGPQVLVRAIPLILRTVPDIEFIFIGRDTFTSGNGTNIIRPNGRSFKEYLINNISEHYRPNVKFLGYVDNEVLSENFKSCTIFVAPSLYESFGFIYIEAMSYAKPVIGCGVGGVPEVIKDGKTGILVPPNDHVSLANAVIDLLTNEEKRRRMGFAAREDVENNFSRDLMAERTEQLYLSLLK